MDKIGKLLDKLNTLLSSLLSFLSSKFKKIAPKNLLIFFQKSSTKVTRPFRVAKVASKSSRKKVFSKIKKAKTKVQSKEFKESLVNRKKIIGGNQKSKIDLFARR